MSDKELNKINSANNEAVLTIEQVKHQLIEQGKKAGHLSHEEIADKLQNYEMDSIKWMISLIRSMKMKSIY